MSCSVVSVHKNKLGLLAPSSCETTNRTSSSCLRTRPVIAQTRARTLRPYRCNSTGRACCAKACFQSTFWPYIARRAALARLARRRRLEDHAIARQSPQHVSLGVAARCVQKGRLGVERFDQHEALGVFAQMLALALQHQRKQARLGLVRQRLLAALYAAFQGHPEFKITQMSARTGGPEWVGDDPEQHQVLAPAGGTLAVRSGVVVMKSSAEQAWGQGAAAQRIVADADEHLAPMRQARGALKQARGAASRGEQLVGGDLRVSQEVAVARIMALTGGSALHVGDAGGVLGSHQAGGMVTKALQLVGGKEVAKRLEQADDGGRRRGGCTHEAPRVSSSVATSLYQGPTSCVHPPRVREVRRSPTPDYLWSP